MRSRALSVVAFVVAVGPVVTLGQKAAPDRLAPSRLEAFVLTAGTRTAWSKFIGRIDGRTASAIVTAIVMEAPVAAQTMRGLRIELRHEGARPDCNKTHDEWSIMCARENAAIYLEEAQFDAVRSLTATGRVEVHPGHSTGITTFHSNGSGGLLLCGFELYGATLDDLAALFVKASGELGKAPR